jgi:hypothetical protein
VTPSLALAATITGTLLTLAPITPQAARNARQLADPDFEIEQHPAVAADLATIAHIAAWMPHWQQAGMQALDNQLCALDRAEDRLLAAHGYPVPNGEQRYRARQARARAVETVHAAAERAHPPTHCPSCRAWEDCPAADRALRDAIHEDWVNRWVAPATRVAVALD